MTRRMLPLAVGALLLCLIATATAGTYALYSDFETSTGNRTAAASVFLGPGASGDLSLSYPPLVLGEPARGIVTVDYRGTVPADVTLALDPGAGPAFCERGPAGWHNVVGLSLVVTVGDRGPVGYCSLLDSGPVVLRESVEPGTAPFMTTVDLTLTENTLVDRIDGLDVLVVEATGGFTDRAEGTLAASVEPVPLPSAEEQRSAAEASTAPPALAAALLAASTDPAAPLDPALVPEECRVAGQEFRPDQVVQLTPDSSPWVAETARGAGTDPLLIFGTDGTDDITGSAGNDCIVGGAGADTVTGGTGDDVLLGGDDTDVLDGGDGADTLDGGAGLDVLTGGVGRDRLDGGPDRATCDGGPDGPESAPGCDRPETLSATPPEPVEEPPAAPPPSAEPAVPVTPEEPAVPAEVIEEQAPAVEEPSPAEPPQPRPVVEPGSEGG